MRKLGCMKESKIRLKINGEMIEQPDKNHHLCGYHLCGKYCPSNVMMSCPKVKSGGHLPLEEYPFITEGKQVLGDKKVRVYCLGEGKIRELPEVVNFTVTKCKRYEDAIKNSQK